MRERVVQFGDGGSLVGVITEPGGQDDTVDYPTVILLNAGTLHRIGPHRIHVNIARRLAAAGFSALRFDLSGLGDSPPRRDNLPYQQSTVRETQDAMDFLAADREARRFLLLGFCGGADIAFRTAICDARVVGVALIDWFAYRTLGWYLRRYAAPFLTLSGWRAFLQAKGAVWQEIRRLVSAERRGGLMNDGVVPPRRRAASDLARLIERGAYLLYVYTGGQLEYYSYDKQFSDTFHSVSFNGRVQVDLHRDADHTLTLLHHQRRLVDTVYQWAVSMPLEPGVGRSQESRSAEPAVSG